jgi:hypothetical protein
MPVPDHNVQPILWYGSIPSSNGFVVALRVVLATKFHPIPLGRKSGGYFVCPRKVCPREVHEKSVAVSTDGFIRPTMTLLAMATDVSC